MEKLLGKKNAVTDIAYSETTTEKIDANSKSYARLGWWIVVAGFGSFVLWASFAPLDQGVPASGTVAVASNKKTIQHPSGGIIQEILVEEGDSVKAGQPLVRMNDIQAKAQYEIARVQYFMARATEARLIAEQTGADAITFPAEIEREKSNPRIAADILLQRQLFESRRAAIKGDLAILEEQLNGMRDLAKQGYVARNRLLDLERTYLQRKLGYQSDVRSQLADVQKEAEALKSRLASLSFDLDNAIVRAPVDGTVVEMNIFTNGGVVNAGSRLMDIVPSDDSLIVEGKVPVNLIDKVHTGLAVDLIFSAFNQSKTPHIPGEISFVSADSLTEQRSGAPYYKMTAKVTPEGMKMIAEHNLQIRPGMPVELFIKTGERTMMNYLLRPIFDRAHASLNEG